MLDRTPAAFGFSLIEILIVMALIAMLIIGLLAALDPVEQIKRGQDATAQTLAKEYFNAQQRYFTLQRMYAGADYVTTSLDLVDSTLPLINAGEFKASYQNMVTTPTGGKVFVTQNDATSEIYVWYLLTSKSFKTNQSLDRCSAFGTCGVDSAACLGAASCYARISGN